LFVIATLPTLRTLDFSPVTAMDRDRARVQMGGLRQRGGSPGKH
jgi:hypothetical protein